MLDGGFLAFVGIVSAPEMRRVDPQPLNLNLALIPVDPVARPTMTAPQRPDVGLMPVQSPLKNNKKAKSGINASRVAGNNAIRFFIADWLDACGETVTRLDDLLKAYNALRAAHPELPEFSKLKLSRLLAAAGCRRMTEVLPRDGKDERGKRLVVFEMRERRAAMQRRAA